MNAVHIYAWEDAPASLRDIAAEMVPSTHIPRWVAWSERSQKPPTYLVALMSKAWVEMMTDPQWNKVLMRNIDVGEIRVGCEKRR